MQNGLHQRNARRACYYFIVLAVNSVGFEFYIVTRSYSSRPFLCALGTLHVLYVIPILHELRPQTTPSHKWAGHETRLQMSLSPSISVVAIIDISIVLATKYKCNPPYNYMYMYMKRRLSGTNFSLENKLLTYRLNAPVVIRAKVKKCEQTLRFIAMHY